MLPKNILQAALGASVGELSPIEVQQVAIPSNSWENEKLGKFSASRIAELCTKDRSGKALGKTAHSYILEVLGELLGDKEERYISKEMQYGIDNEGLAAHLLGVRFKRMKYLGKKFFFHKKYKSWAGASPDFMVGKSISGEIKTAYTTRKYLEYLELNTGADLLAYDKKYYYQVQMQMACTGAKKAYFVAFNPKWVDTAKHKKCLHLIEIEKDEKVIVEIDACLILGIEAISQLRKKHKV